MFYQYTFKREGATTVVFDIVSKYSIHQKYQISNFRYARRAAAGGLEAVFNNYTRFARGAIYIYIKRVGGYLCWISYRKFCFDYIELSIIERSTNRAAPGPEAVANNYTRLQEVPYIHKRAGVARARQGPLLALIYWFYCRGGQPRV